MQFIKLVLGKIHAGKTNCRKRLSTVDLLIKVACFVTKVNNIFNKKAALRNKIQGGLWY